MLKVWTKSSSGCTAGSPLFEATHKQDTCGLGNGNSDFFFNNRFHFGTLTGPGQFYYEVRVFDTDLSPSLRASDAGCFNVGSSMTTCL